MKIKLALILLLLSSFSQSPDKLEFNDIKKIKSYIWHCAGDQIMLRKTISNELEVNKLVKYIKNSVDKSDIKIKNPSDTIYLIEDFYIQIVGAPVRSTIIRRENLVDNCKIDDPYSFNRERRQELYKWDLGSFTNQYLNSSYSYSTYFYVYRLIINLNKVTEIEFWKFGV